MSIGKVIVDRALHQQGIRKRIEEMESRERARKLEEERLRIWESGRAAREATATAMRKLKEEKELVVRKFREQLLPAIGFEIRGEAGVEERIDSENRERRLYSVRVVQDLDSLSWKFSGRGGVRCILTRGSVEALRESCGGYWEYVQVRGVRVVGHSRSGRSCLVEVI